MNYQIYEINKDKPFHLIFKTINNNTKHVDPILELYKGKLFSCIINYFIIDCIDLLGHKIFSIKKSYSRTLTNLLSSWIFSLYIDYDFKEDYFFPSNFHMVESLVETLNDFCKYDSNITNKDIKINKIITNLKTNYQYQLKLLKNYNNTYYYKNNKNNYKIKKYIFKNNKINKFFYRFEIISQFIIKDKRLQNILNNILIPSNILKKLQNIYSGPKNKFDEYIWAIIFRYQLLGSNNHQLAVLPNIMNEMFNDYNLNFECFASSINSTFSNYCSIYWDLEQYFGSVGSFFNIIPLKGTFGFNPPYQKNIIEKGIYKIFNHLDNAKDNLTFIITIPVWDTHGRSIMKELFNNELEKQNIDYGDFEIINEIKNSKYFKKLRMISKENFTYIDYNFNLFKNKTIQNTYVIILSNISQNYDKLDNYNFNL